MKNHCECIPWRERLSKKKTNNQGPTDEKHTVLTLGCQSSTYDHDHSATMSKHIMTCVMWKQSSQLLIYVHCMTIYDWLLIVAIRSGAQVQQKTPYKDAKRDSKQKQNVFDTMFVITTCTHSCPACHHGQDMFLSMYSFDCIIALGWGLGRSLSKELTLAFHCRLSCLSLWMTWFLNKCMKNFQNLCLSCGTNSSISSVSVARSVCAHSHSRAKHGRLHFWYWPCKCYVIRFGWWDDGIAAVRSLAWPRP